MWLFKKKQPLPYRPFVSAIIKQLEAHEGITQEHNGDCILVKMDSGHDVRIRCTSASLTVGINHEYFCTISEEVAVVKAALAYKRAIKDQERLQVQGEVSAYYASKGLHNE